MKEIINPTNQFDSLRTSEKGTEFHEPHKGKTIRHALQWPIFNKVYILISFKWIIEPQSLTQTRPLIRNSTKCKQKKSEQIANTHRSLHPVFHVRFKLAAARIERKRDGGVRNSKNRERRMRDQLEKGNKQLKNTRNDEAYLISRRCRKMAGNRHDKLLKLEEPSSTSMPASRFLCTAQFAARRVIFASRMSTRLPSGLPLAIARRAW